MSELGFDLCFSKFLPFAKIMKGGFFRLPSSPEEAKHFVLVHVVQEGVTEMPVGTISVLRGTEFEAQLPGGVIRLGAGKDLIGADLREQA